MKPIKLTALLQSFGTAVSDTVSHLSDESLGRFRRFFAEGPHTGTLRTNTIPVELPGGTTADVPEISLSAPEGIFPKRMKFRTNVNLELTKDGLEVTKRRTAILCKITLDFEFGADPEGRNLIQDKTNQILANQLNP